MAVEKKAKKDASKKSGTRARTMCRASSASTSRSETSTKRSSSTETLFGLVGRKQAGSRCYFTCGPVTLQVVDVSSVREPHPAAKALYFVVNDLDAIFERATVAAVPVAGGGAWRARRQDQRAAMGRALVLRRGSVAQPAVFRGGGHDLSGLTSRRLPKISRGPFYALSARGSDPFVCSMQANRRGLALQRAALRRWFRLACKVLGLARLRTLTRHHGRQLLSATP